MDEPKIEDRAFLEGLELFPKDYPFFRLVRVDKDGIGGIPGGVHVPEHRHDRSNADPPGDKGPPFLLGMKDMGEPPKGGVNRRPVSGFGFAYGAREVPEILYSGGDMVRLARARGDREVMLLLRESPPPHQGEELELPGNEIEHPAFRRGQFQGPHAGSLFRNLAHGIRFLSLHRRANEEMDDQKRYLHGEDYNPQDLHEAYSCNVGPEDHAVGKGEGYDGEGEDIVEEPPPLESDSQTPPKRAQHHIDDDQEERNPPEKNSDRLLETVQQIPISAPRREEHRMRQKEHPAEYRNVFVIPDDDIEPEELLEPLVPARENPLHDDDHDPDHREAPAELVEVTHGGGAQQNGNEDQGESDDKDVQKDLENRL